MRPISNYHRSPLAGVVPYGPLFCVDDALKTSRYRHSNRLETIRQKGGVLMFSGHDAAGRRRTRKLTPWSSTNFRGRRYLCLPTRELFSDGTDHCSDIGQTRKRGSTAAAKARAATSKQDLCLVEVVSHYGRLPSSSVDRVLSATAGPAETCDSGATTSCDILKRLATLPWELVVPILKHLDYDQVYWLLRTSPYFKRQFLSTHTEAEYRMGVVELRHYLANRLVLRDGERLWAADVCHPQAAVNGIHALTPLAMKPGRYVWEYATSLTVYGIPGPTVFCVDCIDRYDKLKTCAYRTQQAMMLDRSRHTYLVRIPEPGDAGVAGESNTVVCRTNRLDLHGASDCDYLIHAWKSDEQDWLNKAQRVCGTTCTERPDKSGYGEHIKVISQEYRALMKTELKFILTKHPGKLFSPGCKRLFVPIAHALAVIDETSFETLGYMLTKRVCAVHPRLEITAEDRSLPLVDSVQMTCPSTGGDVAMPAVATRSAQVKRKLVRVGKGLFTGLHFLPTCVSNEIEAAKDYVAHRNARHLGDSAAVNIDFPSTQWHWMCRLKGGKDNVHHEHTKTKDVTVCTKITRSTPGTGEPRKESLRYIRQMDDNQVCTNMTVSNIDAVMMSAAFDLKYHPGGRQ